MSSQLPTAVPEAVTQSLRTLARPALLALVGSVIVAVSAQLQVPIGLVPMTMQSLATILVGAALGWRTGGAALALYLAEGLFGLPVFAGFTSGPAILFGPTGGFLFAFVPAAAVAGWLARRGWAAGWFRPVGLGLLGHAIIFAGGLAWLSVVVGPAKAVAVGFLPFVAGTLIKVALGTVFIWATMAPPDRGVRSKHG
jgi:biotin transport system substrate-specific component